MAKEARRGSSRVLGMALLVTVIAVACGGSDDEGDFSQSTCDASTCDGCCSFSGMCVAGTAREECGISGASCVECPEFQSCSQIGRCEACDSSTCLGCCDEEGQCQPGDKSAACGDQGEHCSVCGGPAFPNATECYELDLSTHYCAQYQP
jgi:hypothetical protein